jgi:hypothetical protein
VGGLSGGGVVPSSLFGVHHVIMIGLLALCIGVKRQSWVFSMSTLCLNLLSCMGQIVSRLAPNSLISYYEMCLVGS